MNLTVTESSIAVRGTVGEVTAWLRQQRPQGGVPARVWLAHWLAVNVPARTGESSPNQSGRNPAAGQPGR